jgi:hypothetical protein
MDRLTEEFFSLLIIRLILSGMKAPLSSALPFSLATALAENRPAENSDQPDHARASAALLAGAASTKKSPAAPILTRIQV